MTHEQFCYWLQGFVEIGGNTLTPEQWKMVGEHLATVFKKVTPILQQQWPRPTQLPIDQTIPISIG